MPTSDERPDPTAGPFSFGVDDVVNDVLGDAGWNGIGLHGVDLPLYFGGPGTSVPEAVDTAMSMSGLQAYLASYDEQASELAASALLETFDQHFDGRGVRLEASILVVTATA